MLQLDRTEAGLEGQIAGVGSDLAQARDQIAGLNQQIAQLRKDRDADVTREIARRPVEAPRRELPPAERGRLAEADGGPIALCRRGRRSPYWRLRHGFLEFRLARRRRPNPGGVEQGSMAAAGFGIACSPRFGALVAQLPRRALGSGGERLHPGVAASERLAAAGGCTCALRLGAPRLFPGDPGTAPAKGGRCNGGTDAGAQRAGHRFLEGLDRRARIIEEASAKLRILRSANQQGSPATTDPQRADQAQQE